MTSTARTRRYPCSPGLRDRLRSWNCASPNLTVDYVIHVAFAIYLLRSSA